MDNFEEERRSFLLNYFGERGDCTDVDIIIALQNSIKTLDDLKSFLDNYDEWINLFENLSEETDEMVNIYDNAEYDLVDETGFAVGSMVNIVSENKMYSCRYLGKIPAFGLDIKGEKPCFVSNEAKKFFYLVGRKNNMMEFKILSV